MSVPSNSREGSTTKYLLIGAGVAGLTLLLWYGYHKRQQLIACETIAVEEEGSLIDKRKEKKRKKKEKEREKEKEKERTNECVCECGKTIAEGGCPPGYNKELLGKVKKYERHIIVCTGTQPEEWSAKVTTQEGSFAAKLKNAIAARKRDLKARNEKVILTNCDERSEGQPPDLYQSVADLIVYPEKVRYIGVTENDLDRFVEEQLVQGKVADFLKYRAFPTRLVLVCCHGNRDTRCGEQGPAIFDAFQKALAVRNINEDDVMVRQSSHLGGHKYAGVVLIYPHGDWYGFVNPDKIDALVEEDLQKGEIVSSIWRGRMELGPDASVIAAHKSTHGK